MDLSEFTITLSRNDEIYPKSEKKNRFKTSCLEMSLIPRDIPSLLVLGITFATLWCCYVPYTPCQATEKIREMLEMIRAEMSSIVPHFKPI